MHVLVVLEPHIIWSLNLVAKKLSQLRRLFDGSAHELWSESGYIRQQTLGPTTERCTAPSCPHTSLCHNDRMWGLTQPHPAK